MNRYETHCHTKESSACAHASAKEVVTFYHSLNYAGIFISDHFACGNHDIPDWTEFVNHFCKGYEEAKRYGDEMQFPVLFAFEYTHRSFGGTDFLIYGLDKEFLLQHPEIDSMGLKQALIFFKEHGAFIVHAHPFRESAYIEMIRLLPFQVDGVEIANANRSDRENSLATKYAKAHQLIPSAGSDNHLAHNQARLCGIKTKRIIQNPNDFIDTLRGNDYSIFELFPQEK